MAILVAAPRVAVVPKRRTVSRCIHQTVARSRRGILGDIPRLPGALPHFRFLSPSGFARIRPEKIAEPLYDVMRSATDYLIERDPESQILKEIGERIESIQHTSRDFRLALLAGIGEEYKDRLEEWNRVRSYFPPVSNDIAAVLFGSNGSRLVLTGTCQAALMFGSVAPTIGAGDAMALADWLVRLYSSGREETPLEKLSRAEPLDASDALPGPRATTSLRSLPKSSD